MKDLSCIYKITSKTTGRIYVGSAVNYRIRLTDHVKKLKGNRHENSILQRIFNKYGINDLDFSIIEQIENKDELISREQFYLDFLKPEINICRVAGNCMGRKFSQETLKKLSNSHIGKIISKEQIAKMIQTKKDSGYKVSDETKLKISNANKGNIISYEHKEKLSKAAKGRIPWNKGKTGVQSHSAITKEKISLRLMGRQGNMLGKKHSEETRKKMSISHK